MSVASIIQVNANVQWNCLRAGDGNWVAVCDPLRLTVQATTWSELMEDIGLALDGLMKDLLQTDELTRFLSDHGWSLLSPMPNRRPAGFRFDVPFIPAMMSNGQARELHQ